MTTESIIGIVGSIVGIIAAGVPFSKWAYNKYRKKSLKELMTQLVNTTFLTPLCAFQLSSSIERGRKNSNFNIAGFVDAKIDIIFRICEFQKEPIVL